MNIKTFLHFLKYPKLSGIWVPFKIFHKAYVHVGKNCEFKLDGRLKLGNEKKLPAVSQAPVNIWFGENSKISFGKSVCIGPGVNLIIKDQAELKVGDNTFFTSDLHLEGCTSIEIGKDCAISWGVTIIDDDHHQIKYSDKEKSHSKSCEVKIGNHVWITNGVIILKGTDIGENSVIASGSVVRGSFPPHSLIGGNPARILKVIAGWQT